MKTTIALLSAGLATTPIWAPTETVTTVEHGQDSKFSYGNCKKSWYAVGYFEQFNQMCSVDCYRCGR